MKVVYSFLRPVAKRYPWLAKLYRDFRSGKSLVKEPKHTPLGFKFIGNSAMESGDFEKVETEIIQRYLKTTDIFVNIGANIGYYCCIALEQKIPTLAFEPIELNLKYLYKNIAANDWQGNIEIFPVALGNKAGLIEIYGGGTSASLVQGWARTPDYYRRWVPVSTLDNLTGSRLNGKQCLVLIDVEGAELLVLEGAATFLDMTPKPIWVIEITVTEHLPEGVHVNPNLLKTFEVFWDHGYRAWTCNRDKRRVNKSEIEAILQTGVNTLKTHNFIFEPVVV
jgi:FkbM family methyltransferase